MLAHIGGGSIPWCSARVLFRHSLLAGNRSERLRKKDLNRYAHQNQLHYLRPDKTGRRPVQNPMRGPDADPQTGTLDSECSGGTHTE